MLVRDAVASDLPGIVAIYNSTVALRTVTADVDPVTVQSREAWFAEHGPDRHPLWIAERDGEMLGWLSFSSFYKRAAYDRTAELSIYVAESRRRNGIGGALLKRAIAHAPTIGIDSLIGLAFAHNAPSVTLFEAHGFARWGFLPRVCVVDGVERDVVLLGLRTSA